jgi:hypothetical protein
MNGVSDPKWNLEVEAFVVHWIIQNEKDTLMLKTIKDYMLP